jgi:hypothetical protein
VKAGEARVVAEVNEVSLPCYIWPLFLKSCASSSGDFVHFVELGEPVEHVVELPVESEDLVVAHFFDFQAGFSGFVN